METTVLNSVKSSTKNWWLSLLLGVLFILLGIWVFRTPLASYISLSMLFSVLIFISGIFGVIFSISNRKEMEGWGWHLTGGILDLMIGSVLVLYPAITMAILPFFVGFWILFRGVFAIGLSFQLRSYSVPNWGLLLFFGILIVLFSFLLLLNPIFTSLGIVYMTALAFVVMGIFRIILAFNLKRIHKYLKNF